MNNLTRILIDKHEHTILQIIYNKNENLKEMHKGLNQFKNISDCSIQYTDILINTKKYLVMNHYHKTDMLIQSLKSKYEINTRGKTNMLFKILTLTLLSLIIIIPLALNASRDLIKYRNQKSKNIKLVITAIIRLIICWLITTILLTIIYLIKTK